MISNRSMYSNRVYNEYTIIHTKVQGCCRRHRIKILVACLITLALIAILIGLLLKFVILAPKTTTTTTIFASSVSNTESTAVELLSTFTSESETTKFYPVTETSLEPKTTTQELQLTSMSTSELETTKFDPTTDSSLKLETTTTTVTDTTTRKSSKF